MSKYSFRIAKSYTSIPEFCEASQEELRVLLAIMEKQGRVTDEELSCAAKVSSARCKSCIAFWQTAGVLDLPPSDAPTVTEEFEHKLYEGELYEVGGRELARGIRDQGLADLFYDIAATVGKTELTPMEVSRITRLSVQYELSAEYLATLCAYMSAEEGFSVEKLVRRGIKLASDGVVTTAALEEYIAEKTRETGLMGAVRRMLGIYNRKLSPSEEKYIHKWIYDYGYSEGIIAEAYDSTVMGAGKLSFPYMDKILSDWYESGCKTLEECIARSNETKSVLKTEKSACGKPKATPKKKTPRYGDFDPEEALKRALDRSFAKSED